MSRGRADPPRPRSRCPTARLRRSISTPRGRMWLATENVANLNVYYSDSPYSSFTGPITLANNINDDDIGVVTALPNGTIGVLWSNQTTRRFGFKVHVDGQLPTTWSADEVPASASALNVGLGMADDHLNVKVASDGTLYAAVKTSYDTAGYPKIALLIRRPNGTWDPLYEVDQSGTRGIVLLNEQDHTVRIVYTSSEGYNDIVTKKSSTSSIAFGPRSTLLTGGVNDVTSTKQNWTVRCRSWPPAPRRRTRRSSLPTRPPASAPPVADFDGDGDTDVSVFRRGAQFGEWDIQAQPPFPRFWGLTNDIPSPATTTATPPPSSPSSTAARSTGSGTSRATRPSRSCGALPTTSPFPATTTATATASSPSSTAGRCTGSGRSRASRLKIWGLANDIPVPGNYDSDPAFELATFHPGAQYGEWSIEDQPLQFWGLANDIPVPSDYDGDGDTDIAVFHPGAVYGEWSVKGQPPFPQLWGLTNDIPVPGNYDSDPASELAVFHRGAQYGEWSIQGQSLQIWGGRCDIPLPLPHALYALLPTGGGC